MSLNKEQLDFAENYFFGDKAVFFNSAPIAQQWFVSYVQDKNSSTVREEVTLYHLGYVKFDKKHGADGKHPVTKKLAEVKPQYAHLDENGKQKKLNGGGTWNDITEEKLEAIKGYDVLCSGFAEDKCLFIVRFPAEVLIPFLSLRLSLIKKRKTISFGWNKYKDSPDLEVCHFDEANAAKFMPKTFYKFLKKKSE